MCLLTFFLLQCWQPYLDEDPFYCRRLRQECCKKKRPIIVIFEAELNICLLNCSCWASHVQDFLQQHLEEFKALYWCNLCKEWRILKYIYFHTQGKKCYIPNRQEHSLQCPLNVVLGKWHIHLGLLYQSVLTQIPGPWLSKALWKLDETWEKNNQWDFFKPYFQINLTVFNGWVIAVNKHIFDKLDSEGRFAWDNNKTLS